VKLTQLMRLYMNQFQPAAYGLCMSNVPSPHVPSVHRDHAQSKPTGNLVERNKPHLEHLAQQESP
jgi:hypothetical protein